MSAFELIIFDCDGVLVDSEPIACIILGDMLRDDLGWPISDAELRERFIGKSMKSTLQTIRDAGFEPGPDFAHELHEREMAVFAQSLKPVPGMPETLDALHDRRRCVASSSSPARIRRSLEITDLLTRFDAAHIFSAEQVTHGKPAPDLFFFAAEQMRVQPRQCVVVEDSIAGIAAARAAGMTVFGLAGTYSAEILAEAGAHVAEQPRDLLRFL